MFFNCYSIEAGNGIREENHYEQIMEIWTARFGSSDESWHDLL